MRKITVNPIAAEPVRLVTTHEGKFLNFNDLIERLKDDRVIDQMLVLMKVGADRRDPLREVMRRVMGDFVVNCGREKL